MSVVAKYIEVVLPLPVTGTYTYSVPQAMQEQVRVGSRVIVPFGRRKFYTGIVTSVTAPAPTDYQVKDIIHVPDNRPIVRHPQLRLWEWMAEYYLCTLGEVYKAAVPTGLKIESETRFEINPDFEPEDLSMLTERETIIYTLLTTKLKMTAKEIEHETGFRTVPQMMQHMFVKGVVVVSESLVSRFKAKKEQYVRIAFARDDSDALKQAFEAVKTAPKQQQMLMTLLQLSNFTNRSVPLAEVTQTALLDKCALTTTILKSLVDKGLVERYSKEISRFKPETVSVDAALPTLSDAQQQALHSIHHQLVDKNTVLLRGVTGSGKTEIYAHLIDHVLKQGNQVLFMVPEIALTTQLTARLYRIFGNRMIVYHSKFTDNERVEIWHRLLASNEPLLIVGVRSSVFLPFAKLGLVIVDEEHDPSYKQYDPAPRYNGRDTAIMLAHMHGAKTVLGSATPAIDTYYKATTGKYGLTELTERYGGATLPTIQIVDMAAEGKKRMVSGSFAGLTLGRIREAVQAGRQAIIFHNRRGYAPMACCSRCQYIPRCKNCDVSLTYHKRDNRLVCHYCGTPYPMPEVCPVCKEPTIEVIGYGTERIEDEVEHQFADSKVLRMDLDTTRNKNSYEQLINAFSQHKADILVGTQMVTKGLDFGDVSVVAAVSADSLINYPDYRSAERAYNMLEQVSGRAGRRDDRGVVMIQTRTPDHPVIGYAAKHDYIGFYEHELAERQQYAYPPFSKLIYIYLKHSDERELDELAGIYGERLRQLFGTRVSGPAKPMVGRVNNLYIRQLMLKIELNASMTKVKDILRQLYLQMHSTMPAMRQLTLYYDVDPA